MIELKQKGFSKSRAAKLSGISRSMLYYRKRARVSRYDSDLGSRILRIVEERPSYGSRRIGAMMSRDGVIAGRNRIRRHMRHLNLIPAHLKGKRRHVPRALVVARPNVMWETDFTRIYIEGEGWLYLTAYIDLCSRKIKGYLVSRMSRTSEMI